MKAWSWVLQQYGTCCMRCKVSSTMIKNTTAKVTCNVNICKTSPCRRELFACTSYPLSCTDFSNTLRSCPKERYFFIIHFLQFLQFLFFLFVLSIYKLFKQRDQFTSFTWSFLSWFFPLHIIVFLFLVLARCTFRWLFELSYGWALLIFRWISFN